MFEPGFERTQDERTGDTARPFQFNHSEDHKDRIQACIERVQHEYFDSGLKDIKSSNIDRKDRLQVGAFQAACRLLYDLTPEERLATAIVQTSDDMFLKADKAKIRQWELKYG